MASPLNGRVKRLEASAGVGQTRYYALLPDPMSVEEWTALCCGSNDRNIVEELKPLKPTAYVRRTCTRLRAGPLETAIVEEREALAVKTQPQFWVCADRKEVGPLISELARVSSFTHAFVFTDLEDEMHLGPGRHRIDQ
jgi:hypothetical protein